MGMMQVNMEMQKQLSTTTMSFFSGKALIAHTNTSFSSSESTPELASLDHTRGFYTPVYWQLASDSSQLGC